MGWIVERIMGQNMCNLIEHLKHYPLDLGNCVEPSRKTANINLSKLNNNVGNSQVDWVKLLSSSPRTWSKSLRQLSSPFKMRERERLDSRKRAFKLDLLSLLSRWIMQTRISLHFSINRAIDICELVIYEIESKSVGTWQGQRLLSFIRNSVSGLPFVPYVCSKWSATYVVGHLPWETNDLASVFGVRLFPISQYIDLYVFINDNKV